MNGLSPDGKPTGQMATFTGASKANTVAKQAMKHKMKLTKEEQAILNDSEGEQHLLIWSLGLDQFNPFKPASNCRRHEGSVSTDCLV